MKNKNYLIAIGLIFLLALALRLYFNFNFTPPEKSDIPYLHSYARNVMNGEFYGTEGAYWPPGYIFFAGFVLKLFGDSQTYFDLRIVQSIISAISAVLMVIIGSTVFNKPSGLTAGFLFSIYPPIVMFTGLFFSETLFLMLFFIMVICVYRLSEHLTLRNSFLTGILLGLVTLTRPVTLPLPLIIAVYIFWVNKGVVPLKRIVMLLSVLVLSMFLSILPWTIRNYKVMGQPVLIDVNGGINFYLAHNPKANGVWVDLGKNDPVIKLRDQPTADKLGYKLGMDYLIQNPAKELRLSIKKMKLFWLEGTEGIIQYYSGETLKKIYDRLSIPMLKFWVLVILGITGMLMSIRREKPWFLILFILYYNALIVAFYYSSRYRLVVEPLLIIFMAYVVSWVFIKIKTLVNKASTSAISKMLLCCKIK